VDDSSSPGKKRELVPSLSLGTSEPPPVPALADPATLDVAMESQVPARVDPPVEPVVSPARVDPPVEPVVSPSADKDPCP